MTTTCFWPSSSSHVISGRKSHGSLPSGPSTEISLAGHADLHAGGNDDGLFSDTRHISLTFATTTRAFSGRLLTHAGLPQFAQHFAAQVALPGFAVADHAAAGADDRDAQAVEHRTQIVGAAIHPAARLADPLDVPNHAFAVGAVLQLDAQARPLARPRLPRQSQM